MSLTKLLKPASIAIIGANEKPGFGGGTTKNILTYRKDLSRVYFIHPTREEVYGHKCYKKVDDVDDTIDLAVICTPQPTVLGLLREAHAKGCEAAVVYASGYSEIGPEGVALERELQDLAAELNMSIMGPNCGGFVNYVDDVYSFAFLGDYANKRGGIGFVSQSGKFVIDMMNSPELRFSYALSVGNSRVTTVEDYFEFLVNDPDTSVVAAYVEGIKNPIKFERSLRAAAQAKKPVLILKMGRSPKGQAAAASHTGSMSGADQIFDAVFKKYGVIRVDDMQDMRSTAALFGTLKALPKTAAFASLNQSGGERGLAADLGYMHGVEYPDFSEQTLKRMKELLADYASPSNPLDMTAGTPLNVYFETLAVGMADENVSAGLLGMLVGPNPIPAERMEGFAALAKKFPDKPMMLLNIMERPRNPEVVAAFQEMGIAVLPTMAYGFRAVRHLADFVEYCNAADAPTLSLAIPEKAPSGKTRALGEYSSKKLLQEAGVPVDVGEVVQSAEQAVEVAKRFGFPVVLKIESDDILHKSDVGGVKLNLKSEAEVAQAYADILDSAKQKMPGARINGVLVQKMLSQGIEMILGVNSDPQFGPMLLVGLGGVFVEVFKDASLYPCPLDRKEAEQMLTSLKAYKLLTGYRGGEPADVEALIDTIVAVSEFAVRHKDSLKELDINPLFVYPKGKGVAIADALVILHD
ncbi:MAG: acetate--CoA ligase family protein [Clostridiales bacterium]|nr:acetate--CoA ligase family protein [Clostridiales bacterium]